MSWLSCQLSERTDLLIKECMAEFSQVEPVHSDRIMQIGRFHLSGVGDGWETWDHMRNAVIDEVTVRGRAQQPSVVVNPAEAPALCRPGSPTNGAGMLSSAI